MEVSGAMSECCCRLLERWEGGYRECARHSHVMLGIRLFCFGSAGAGGRRWEVGAAYRAHEPVQRTEGAVLCRTTARVRPERL
eukprot:2030203-Rhodomonas_salina.2